LSSQYNASQIFVEFDKDILDKNKYKILLSFNNRLGVITTTHAKNLPTFFFSALYKGIKARVEKAINFLV
jgi:hypothetical protein